MYNAIVYTNDKCHSRMFLASPVWYTLKDHDFPLIPWRNSSDSSVGDLKRCGKPLAMHGSWYNMIQHEHLPDLPHRTCVCMCLQQTRQEAFSLRKLTFQTEYAPVIGHDELHFTRSGCPVRDAHNQQCNKGSPLQKFLSVNHGHFFNHINLSYADFWPYYHHCNCGTPC